MLSKENPEDRKVIMKILRSTYISGEKEMKPEEKVDRLIELENGCIRDFGNYFLNLVDISKKYPAAKVLALRRNSGVKRRDELS